MAYDLVPILILLACGVGLAAMVGRKLSQLKTLDVESIPAERERQLKQHLLATRLQRRTRAMGRFLAAAARPLLQRMVQAMQRWYRRILEVEAKYRRPAVPPGAPLPADELATLLAEAEQLQTQGAGTAAEEKLMQVVARDPKNIAAYERLGTLYLATREYAKAREVYVYLLKLFRRNPPAGNNLKSRLAAAQINLAAADVELGRNAQALQAARKAAALEPNNPRTLDFLLKISILVKDKPLAETTWQALKSADPQNAKLKDLRTQIDQLQ